MRKILTIMYPARWFENFSFCLHLRDVLKPFEDTRETKRIAQQKSCRGEFLAVWLATDLSMYERLKDKQVDVERLKQKLQQRVERLV